MSNRSASHLSNWGGMFLAMAFLAAVAGCKPPAKVAPPETAAADAAPKVEPWHWESFPVTNILNLGNVTCRIQAKRTLNLQSPAGGRLRVYVRTLETNLPKDTIWAELAPELYEEESNSLHRAQVKLEERRDVMESVELPRATLKARKDFKDSERQLRVAGILSSNQWLRENASRLPELTANLQDADAITILEQGHKLNSLVLNELSRTNWSLVGNDPTVQMFELEQKSLQLERKRREGQIRMPFEGKLTVALPLAEGVDEYLVAAGEQLGSVTDNSGAYAKIAISDPIWLGLPGEKLRLQVQAGQGAPVALQFEFQRRERAGNNEQTYYYFRAPDAQAERLMKYAGSDLNAGLFFNIGMSARIVPKLKAILQGPEVFRGKTFRTGVMELWKGAVVLMEGEQEAAILPNGTPVSAKDSPQAPSQSAPATAASPTGR